MLNKCWPLLLTLFFLSHLISVPPTFSYRPPTQFSPQPPPPPAGPLDYKEVESEMRGGQPSGGRLVPLPSHPEPSLYTPVVAAFEVTALCNTPPNLPVCPQSDLREENAAWGPKTWDFFPVTQERAGKGSPRSRNTGGRNTSTQVQILTPALPHCVTLGRSQLLWATIFLFVLWKVHDPYRHCEKYL